MLIDHAFWANPEGAARRADRKALQLQLAPAAGLNIVKTLISNRPEAIRQFISTHEQTIYKPLIGHVWHEDGRTFGSFTSRVRLKDLPSDTLLRAAPGIFQAQIPKQYEVRAQIMGNTCMAVRIDSTYLRHGEFDWRMDQASLDNAPIIEVPPTVKEACRTLMRSLGIISGAFDFIVTPDDEWIFLEVNESGQFLFLEQLAPDLPILDAYCAFLESANPEFIYQPTHNPIRFSELRKALPANETIADDRRLREQNLMTAD